MMDAFERGGWGMYPTAIAGFVLVGMAIQFARNGDARRNASVRSMMFLTFLVGALGTVTGVIKSFCTLEATTPVNYALIGVGESLHCLGMAMVSMVLAGIFVQVGRARTGSSAADLADPHAPS
jgi:hypothetical protein